MRVHTSADIGRSDCRMFAVNTCAHAHTHTHAHTRVHMFARVPSDTLRSYQQRCRKLMPWLVLRVMLTSEKASSASFHRLSCSLASCFITARTDQVHYSTTETKFLSLFLLWAEYTKHLVFQPSWLNTNNSQKGMEWLAGCKLLRSASSGLRPRQHAPKDIITAS